MNRHSRALCAAACALAGLGLLAAAAEPTAARSAPAGSLATATSTAPATTPPPLPPTTTTTAVVPRLVHTPRPSTAAPAAARMATATTAPAAIKPVAQRPTTHAASCGWAWDATRMDDGSSNEVTIMLDAPRQPDESVVITVSPGGPTTAPISQPTITDGGGQAASTFPISNDKRDWTLTASARFASGATCSTPPFTLDY